MQFLQEYEMTGKDLICPKCNRTVARIIDDVYMIIGEARFYESVRFTCSCHKPLYFRVKDFDVKGFEGETKQILHGLGNSKKFQQQKRKRKE
jgi:hypothetical protein